MILLEELKVSVIIPTYNRLIHLQKTIKSVQEQTYKNLEIIVIDDNSSDGTRAYIKSLKDERILYVKHDLNMGHCAARNTGIHIASGNFISFIDSDDLMLSNCISSFVSECIKDCNIDYIYAGWIWKNFTTNKVSKKRLPDCSGNINNLPFWTYNIIPHFVKKNIIKKTFFDLRYKNYENIDINIRIKKGSKKYMFIQDILFEYQDHQDVRASSNYTNTLFGIELLLKEHLDDLSDYKNYLSDKYLTAAIYSSKVKRKKLTVLKYFMASIKVNPFNKRAFYHFFREIIK